MESVAIDGVPIRRRLGSAYAHAKLAEALFEIAHEAIDPALTGPHAAAARSWLRVGIERPIVCATDAALDRFCAELELLIDEAPDEFRASLWGDASSRDDLRAYPIAARRPTSVSPR